MSKQIAVCCGALLLLSACTVGPFEEREKLSDPKGPGVFSGEKGEFSASDLFDDKKPKGGGYYILDLDGSPPMTEAEFKEFEMYRAWLLSREAGTNEYQEYENWKKFQEFLQHEASQAK